VEDLLQAVWQVVYSLGKVAALLLQLIAGSALLVVWVAWWLWGVNWQKTWPVLKKGAWLPLVLLVNVAALVWSQIAPSDYVLTGSVVIPNFWWQLSAVTLLVLLTLFCGWLQGIFACEPPELSLEPPAPIGDHGHGHGH